MAILRSVYNKFYRWIKDTPEYKNFSGTKFNLYWSEVESLTLRAYNAGLIEGLNSKPSDYSLSSQDKLARSANT
jgi:hypothetical protein